MSKLKTAKEVVEGITDFVFYETAKNQTDAAVPLEDVERILIEYGKMILDHAAKEAMIELCRYGVATPMKDYSDDGGIFQVNEESILKIKEQLK